MAIIRGIRNALTTALVVLTVAAAILLVGVRLVGLQPYTVLSGSMEPNYHVGSLIYVVKVDPLTLKKWDAITFQTSNGTVVTHRIIAVIPDEEDPGVVRFQTQGDANNAPDGDLVHGRNVIGKVVFSIPLMGYAAAYLQSPIGAVIAIGICSVIVCMVFLPDLLSGKTEEETGKR